MSKLLFSTFDVTKQVFYRSRLSFGLVNIHPILPGHVLVVPQRVVPRLSDLSPEELADVFQTAQTVSQVIEKAFDGESMTLACQDGPAAGQSVPHVHIHLLPRKFVDFAGDNDKVYPELEKSEDALGESLSRKKTPVPMMDERSGKPPRTVEEMEKEAAWLSTLFK
ncbi:diadenosine 5',5'''-P1,P4-tetraphosphate asymmetrical hydrolase [Clavulina sp. PMI_390]|nr:diadenosine 5',5'''-P1,P4-tetraphosphate asymmetrical hydrolase [Clavulina sp. PMI_390]